MKFIFVIIMIIWTFIGLLSTLHARDNIINWYMFIFLGFAPFIPIIAYFCGLI